MRQPIKPESADSYERPNQSWVCGLAEEGPPCPVGPTAAGYCSRAMGCHPVREGDRWVCNRSTLRGGPCDAGPTPEGECTIQYSCTPLRSLRARRGRFVVAVALATLGGLSMLLSSEWRNEFVSPGPLSVHHAQLVARAGDQSNRCASCHAAGNQLFVQWLSHIHEPGLASPSQSDLCLECHKEEIPPEFALSAHNVDPDILLVSHEGGGELRRVNPTGSFACSTCHKEHHGAAHDLRFMSDSACQACHKEQYHSFTAGHPEFSNWPHGRRTRIAFDHAKHQAKHFPEKNEQFACSTCHRPTEDGAFQTTLNYAATCSKCHDADIETSWKTGVPFVSLPMIDVEILNDAGRDIGPWPEQATGDFDGTLPVITKFLLLADDKAAGALEALGVDFDFYDIDPDDPGQLAAAADIVAALKNLLGDLAERGHAAIEGRLETILGQKPTAKQLADCAAHLSRENMAAVGAQWLSIEKETRPISPSSDQSPLIGWTRDDQTFALRYRPAGHDDVWLTAWISLISQATKGPQAKTAEGLLLEMVKPTAMGMCGTCHSVDRTTDGGLEVQWRAEEPRFRRDFTVFSHAPHTLQHQLADCTACHRIDESATVMESYAAHDPTTFASGFHAMTKQDCATCHKPAAAGDSCTQCHRYHIQ